MVAHLTAMQQSWFRILLLPSPLKTLAVLRWTVMHLKWHTTVG
jgi:hypothetical protein